MRWFSFSFIYLLNLWHNQYLDVHLKHIIFFSVCFFLLFLLFFFVQIGAKKFFMHFIIFYLFSFFFFHFVIYSTKVYSSNYNVIVMLRISFTSLLSFFLPFYSFYILHFNKFDSWLNSFVAVVYVLVCIFVFL